MEMETRACRHGRLTFFADDSYVGRSLKMYGDYSEDEVEVFKKVLKPDHVAVEVGSNIGALTIPMATLCRKVYAFEPQPENFDLLRRNLLQNDLIDKVVLSACAVGSTTRATWISSLEALGHTNYGNVEVGHGDVKIQQVRLDFALQYEKDPITFIKIDVEGYELEVLNGATDTIAKWRPILYVENDRPHKSADLVGWLVDHEYRCYWHHSPLYYDGNYLGEKMNAFGRVVAVNMICVPEERNIKVERLDEVDDKRSDDQVYIRQKARALKRLERDPDDIDAMVIAAHFSNLMGQRVEARQMLKENLKRDPHHAGTLAVLGLMQLQDGEYKQGWQSYELRYLQLNPKSFGWRPHDVPQWQGEETNDIILVWAEQGFGDSIMFARFMGEVLRRAPNAILEVQPQLYELFETSEIMPPGQLFRLGRSMPEYTRHCALPSLPAIFRLEHPAQHFPDPYPYLKADRAMVESWLKRQTPRIGICMRGGAASERAYSRDMPPEIADRIVKNYGGPFMALTHEGQWESFADTAGAIMALDLVITVDTSIAHLSGALGMPTWLMLSTDPDFRWGVEGNATIWYPSVRIFRQKQFQNWDNVVDEVSAALKQHKARKAA